MYSVQVYGSKNKEVNMLRREKWVESLHHIELTSSSYGMDGMKASIIKSIYEALVKMNELTIHYGTTTLFTHLFWMKYIVYVEKYDWWGKCEMDKAIFWANHLGTRSFLNISRSLF